MRALTFERVGELSLEERPKPRTENPDDVIVKVKYTGICGTDRNILLGRFPAREGVVLGHESVGTIEETGDAVTGLTGGDRVIIDPTLYCGRCPYCRSGDTSFCENKAGTEVGVDRDGTAAEYVALPERFVHKLPEQMSYERAVLVEPLACVLNNAEAAGLKPDDEVLVLGGGPIGLLWSMFASKYACRVTLAETDSFRLGFARKLLDNVVDVSGLDADGNEFASTLGGKPQVVVDTTGTLLEFALQAVDQGGRVVLMGFNADYESTVRPLDLTMRGVRMIGAGDYNSNTFLAAIKVASTLELERLVTHTLTVEDHAEAFDLLGVPTNGGDSATPLSRPGYGSMKVLFDLRHPMAERAKGAA